MSYVLILRYLRFYLRNLICLMNNHTQDIQFSPLRSQPNPIVTLILRIVFVPLLIAIPVIFYALPALFVMETPPIFSTQADEIIFVIITYFILTGMYWYGFQYLKKIGSRAVVQIEVNQTGVHYEHYNGTISSVLYQDLDYSDNYYIKDLHTVSLYKGPTLLKAFWMNPNTGKATTHTITFDTDIVYGKYTGNKSDLIGRFILGVHLFRPDLTVCDTVYSNFYINRDTYAFDKKSHLKVMIGAAIAIIVIVYLIYLFTP